MEPETNSQEDTPQNETGGASTLYDKTLQIVQRQELANKKREELLEREEELTAKKMLGGQSEAGVETPPKPKELTEKEQELADIEFAHQARSGEIDVFKEDGFT